MRAQLEFQFGAVFGFLQKNRSTLQPGKHVFDGRDSPGLIHASSKLTAVWVTACGHPARWATATEIHNPMAQATGVMSGTSRSVTHDRWDTTQSR